MSAYLVVTMTVTDPEAYRRYTAVTPALIARHGGRFVTRGAPVETLEGAALGKRLVIVEFPDLAAARALYDDPDYQAASVNRRAGAPDVAMWLQDGCGAAPEAGV